jgi:hypothetical protein
MRLLTHQKGDIKKMTETICKYCGEKINRGHHCSGKKAYQKGKQELCGEIEKSELVYPLFASEWWADLKKRHIKSMED